MGGKLKITADLCNLAVCVFAKFEGCAAKTLGGVGIFKEAIFFKKKALSPNFASRLPVGQFKLSEMTRNDLWCDITSLIKFDDVF